MIYSVFKNVAFRFDPEFIHHLAFWGFHNFPKLCSVIMPGIKVTDDRYTVSSSSSSNGFSWPFPVGVAAGLDKEAQAFKFLQGLGFGSVEVGTVTPDYQKGNDRPRIFRHIKEKSLRNFMGLPNSGMETIYENISIASSMLTKRTSAFGVNLGKGEQTDISQAGSDYLKLYQKFAEVSDYLTINISCPNVENLRELQGEELLESILEQLALARKKNPTRLFIKISPELEKLQLEKIVEISNRFAIDGIIATNTLPIPELGVGGISGDLLYQKSGYVRKQLLEMTQDYPDLEVIGSGGFSHFSQILDFWKDGGKFVQLYTAFIYQGPKVLKKIKKGIDEILTREKVSSLQELFNAGYFTDDS